MKIRNGFVSNSSSGSFILNCDFTEDQIKEKLQIMINCYNELEDSNLQLDDILYIDTIDKKFVQDDNEHYGKYYDYTRVRKEDIGKTVINTTSDNSIPHEIMELIESYFDANYLHYG